MGSWRGASAPILGISVAGRTLAPSVRGHMARVHLDTGGRMTGGVLMEQPNRPMLALGCSGSHNKCAAMLVPNPPGALASLPQ